MEKQTKNQNISRIETAVAESRYTVELTDGVSVACRSYEPAKDKEVEDAGIILVGGGFGGSLDAQVPSASYLAELCGETVVTAETSIGDRESQKVDKFLQVIKDAAAKYPDKKMSFLFHSEGGNYGSKAILKLLEEDSDFRDKIGQIVFASSAGLIGEDNPLALAARFAGDSANPYYLKDLKQTGTYLKGFGADIGKNAVKAPGTIGDIAASDTRKSLKELKEIGIPCFAIAAHSDGAFPVGRMVLEDGTTVHDAEFINPKHKHGALLFKLAAVEAVADILTSHNHPEIWTTRAKTRHEEWKKAQEAHKKLGHIAVE